MLEIPIKLTTLANDGYLTRRHGAEKANEAVGAVKLKTLI
jgi:hypothetical protein